MHKGHIQYFKFAKEKGDALIVIINNDQQRTLKGSKTLMLEDERALIVSELKIVDRVYLSIDQDRTVCRTIKKIHSDLKKTFELYFANGGDQNNKSIPEREICEKIGIGLLDGLGAKIQSSSWLLKNSKSK